MRDASSCVPAGREFSNCVALTHATWMFNHAAFAPGFTGRTKDRAVAGARLLGYELYVAHAEIIDPFVNGQLNVKIAIRNLGVAPFYYDWSVQLRALDSNNQAVTTWDTSWKLTALLPATTNTMWGLVAAHSLPAGTYKLLLRVQNPLTNGLPFRFANQTQDAAQPAWLTLGSFSVLAALAKPTRRGTILEDQLQLNISGAAAGVWIVEGSSNIIHWQPLLVTNASVNSWAFGEPISSSQRFSG